MTKTRFTRQENTAKMSTTKVAANNQVYDYGHGKFVCFMFFFMECFWLLFAGTSRQHSSSEWARAGSIRVHDFQRLTAEIEKKRLEDQVMNV